MKGDIAVAKVIADLTVKGYYIFLPVSEHLRFDLVAYKDDKFLKIQVKYSSGDDNGSHAVRGSVSWCNNTGSIRKKYQLTDFDYFAVYLADIDKVVYPNITFKDIAIRTALVNHNGIGFYWFEDFLDFTDTAQKHKRGDLGGKLGYVPRNNARKVEWPTKEELCELVEMHPLTTIAKSYGVDSNSVKDWCDKYEIPTKPRGFWQKARMLEK